MLIIKVGIFTAANLRKKDESNKFYRLFFYNQLRKQLLIVLIIDNK